LLWDNDNGDDGNDVSYFLPCVRPPNHPTGGGCGGGMEMMKKKRVDYVLLME
jgi:hypothetical protein